MQLIRRIDVPVRDIRWSDSGELVAIVSESSFYILRLDNQAVDAFLASGEEAEDDGLEDAFELLNEVSERVRTGTPPTSQQHAECSEPQYVDGGLSQQCSDRGMVTLSKGCLSVSGQIQCPHETGVVTEPWTFYKRGRT